MVDPWAAQDGHGADQCQPEAGIEGEPAEQGWQPYVPGDRHGAATAFIELFYRRHVVDDHPIRQHRMDQLSPIVLRRIVVEGAGDHRQQHAGDTTGRDRGGDGHHDEDRYQLSSTQRPTSTDDAERDLQGQQQNEEQEEGRRCAGAQAEAGALNDHAAVGNPYGDDGAHYSTNEDPAVGYATALKREVGVRHVRRRCVDQSW